MLRDIPKTRTEHGVEHGLAGNLLLLIGSTIRALWTRLEPESRSPYPSVDHTKARYLSIYVNNLVCHIDTPLPKPSYEGRGQESSP